MVVVANSGSGDFSEDSDRVLQRPAQRRPGRRVQPAGGSERHPDDAVVRAQRRDQARWIRRSEASHKAVAPAYKELEHDALTGELIADVRDWQRRARSPGRRTQSAAGGGPVDPGDLAGDLGTPLPDGTYRRDLVADEAFSRHRRGAGASAEGDGAGRLTLIFNGQYGNHSSSSMVPGTETLQRTSEGEEQ